MKLVYKGKYSGDESTLPQREHPEGYVPYKEPNSMKNFALLLNGISIIVLIFMFWVTYMILNKNGIEINKMDFSYCLYVGLCRWCCFSDCIDSARTTPCNMLQRGGIDVPKSQTSNAISSWHRGYVQIEVHFYEYAT